MYFVGVALHVHDHAWNIPVTVAPVHQLYTGNLHFFPKEFEFNLWITMTFWPGSEWNKHINPVFQGLHQKIPCISRNIYLPARLSICQWLLIYIFTNFFATWSFAISPFMPLDHTLPPSKRNPSSDWIRFMHLYFSIKIVLFSNLVVNLIKYAGLWHTSKSFNLQYIH